MGDLVLKTRVAVTKRNLRRIEDLSRTLSERAGGLRKFLSLPEVWLAKLSDIQSDSNKLSVKARGYRFQSSDPEKDPYVGIEDLRNGINDLNRKIDSICEEVGPSTDDARRLRGELFQFEELSRDGRDIQDLLTQRAWETESSLTVQNYLAQRDQIESFFAEYVDLLHAIALRSAGFQQEDGQLSDIFRIADHLPRLWGRVEGWEWTSLAVPSYAELNRKSQAMMLRLGFPEWTLWALPFVQNEFAHVYVAKKPGLTAGSASSRSVTLLADALASMVTGPAYACAALLLRLDPAAVTEPPAAAALRSAAGPAALTEPSATVALRSATIIHSLDRVAGGEETPLGMLSRRLRTEWRDAVKFAGGDPQAFDEAMKDPEVNMAAQRAQGAVLDMDQSPTPAWASRWATIAKWSDLLQQNKAAEIVLQDAGDSPRPIALAFLLNAAWLARVGPAPAADAPESKLDIIATGAIRRMLEIAQPARKRVLGSAAKARPHP